MKTVLCADIGTSSLKAALIDSTGKVLAKSRRKFLLVNTDHSSKEWLPALQNAVQELFLATPETVIDGICISGNGPTLVSVSGETLMWSDKAYNIPSKSLFIPRILAFKDKYPSVWKETKYIFGAPEYLIWLLTDSAVSILPEERFREAYWTDELLAQAGLCEEECNKLPPFKMTTQQAGTISYKCASFLGHEENGIKAGLKVYCGAPDFICALAGTGTLKPGVLCDRAGSSEGINFCSSEPVYGDGIRTLPSVVPGLWNASVLLPDSGSSFAAFKQKIERETGRTYEYDELMDTLISSDGTNPTLDQGKYHLIQTALDVKTAIQTLAKAVKEKGHPFPDRMTITGAQASNRKRNQMKADITGIRICVTECPDAELMGDAVFAFTGMGIFDSIPQASQALVRISDTFVPSVEE